MAKSPRAKEFTFLFQLHGHNAVRGKAFRWKLPKSDGGFALTPAKATDLGGDCYADLEERVAELEAEAARKYDVQSLIDECLDLITIIFAKLKGPVVYRPVGRRLRNFADFVYPPRTNELIFHPTLRDLEEEYCKALELGQTKKAVLVRWRGYLSFWIAVLNHLPLSIVKKVVEMWKAVN